MKFSTEQELNAAAASLAKVLAGPIADGLLKVLMVGAGKGAGKVAGEFHKRYQFQLPNGIRNGSRLNSGPPVPKIVKRDKAPEKPSAGHINKGNKNDISKGILGQWHNVNETMSARARAYQQQITGRYGQAYIVEGVKFDGVAAGFLSTLRGRDTLISQRMGSSVIGSRARRIW